MRRKAPVRRLVAALAEPLRPAAASRRLQSGDKAPHSKIHQSQRTRHRCLPPHSGWKTIRRTNAITGPNCKGGNHVTKRFLGCRRLGVHRPRLDRKTIARRRCVVAATGHISKRRHVAVGRHPVFRNPEDHRASAAGQRRRAGRRAAAVGVVRGGLVRDAQRDARSVPNQDRGRGRDRAHARGGPLRSPAHRSDVRRQRRAVASTAAGAAAASEPEVFGRNRGPLGRRRAPVTAGFAVLRRRRSRHRQGRPRGIDPPRLHPGRQTADALEFLPRRRAAGHARRPHRSPVADDHPGLRGQAAGADALLRHASADVLPGRPRQLRFSRDGTRAAAARGRRVPDVLHGLCRRCDRRQVQPGNARGSRGPGGTVVRTG